MPDPTKFKNPCNCFGGLGQFEMEMEFHEMGIQGCRRPVPPEHPFQRFIDLATEVAENYEPSSYLKKLD